MITYDYAAVPLTYSNTGPIAYATPTDLSGSVVFTNPLAPNLINAQVTPLSYSFAGFNPGDANAVFDFSTNSAGAITGWSINLHTDLQYAVINSVDDQFYGYQNSCVSTHTYCGVAIATAAPGHWQIEAPELDPAGLGGAMTMLVIGAILLRRRR